QSIFLLHLIWDKFVHVSATLGPSMLPTFNTTDDWILVSRLHTLGRGCKVGDVISYTHPVDGPGVFVTKRIIGMEGDFVVKDPMDGTGEMLQVPQGHVWTTGDNLPHSVDSRQYGPVPKALIRGKVLARVFPL
ncbi:LexA/Signal peptidase, partial [Ascodesmis nigricans]